MRKGVVLAGGSGSRLLPLTKAFSKHLLPVYDKPMIFYPVVTLALSGITEILVISNERDIPLFKDLFLGAEKHGVDLQFAVQDSARGVADGLIVAESFLKGAPSALILGDNLFFGAGFSSILRAANEDLCNNTIFSVPSSNPKEFGVVEISKKGRVVSLEEKPQNPKSNNVVTGLYFLDADAPEIAKSLNPSPRGELEIIDLLKYQQVANKLTCVQLGRGFLWMDMGTFDNLLSAGEIIKTYQERLGVSIGSFTNMELI